MTWVVRHVCPHEKGAIGRSTAEGEERSPLAKSGWLLGYVGKQLVVCFEMNVERSGASSPHMHQPVLPLPGENESQGTALPTTPQRLVLTLSFRRPSCLSMSEAHWLWSQRWGKLAWGWVTAPLLGCPLGQPCLHLPIHQKGSLAWGFPGAHTTLKHTDQAGDGLHKWCNVQHREVPCESVYNTDRAGLSIHLRYRFFMPKVPNPRP